MANGAGQKRRPLEPERPAPAAPAAMTGAGGGEVRPPLARQEEDEAPAAATKVRRLEHHRSTSDALARPPSPAQPFFSSMEDLPEEIQLLIMSLLPPKEAARATTVWRNWRKLWTCYPNLCFDGTKDWFTEEDSVQIERAKFIETVDSIIQQHSGIGLNKLSIRFSPQKNKNYSDHVDRWIFFATSSKAKIIDINLKPKGVGPATKDYNFPLEALGAPDGPFIQSLFLKDVSIKPHSDICGFTKLRRLCLRYVQIIGDLPGLLNNCCALEDLELFACYGVANVNVPHQLGKLRHLLISHMRAHSIDIHVTGLTHFEYTGVVIPIALHGCSKLEKVTLAFKSGSLKIDNDALEYAFAAIPTISAVKVLNVDADMPRHQPVWAPQVHMAMKRPACMFTVLRHLTCQIKIFTDDPNSHDGILRFAHYLDRAPQLETLQLHMLYFTDNTSCWRGEATGEEVSSFMGRLHHLKAVYMSGFRCYRPQVELLCGILEKGDVLQHVTIQPKVTIKCVHTKNCCIRVREIRAWALCASDRFGKVINVVNVPLQQWWW